jgi:SusD/RagB-like outer membrane lipoprotein
MKSVINIKIAAGLALLVLMISSCTEHFEELNTRNDLVTQEVLNTDLLMTYIQYQAIVKGLDGGSSTTGNYPGMSVSNSNRPFQVSSGSTWGPTYGTYIRNIADLIRVLEEKDAEDGTNDNASMIGIARILKVWAFSRVTDSYGDVPYTESALPQEQVVYSPKYDTQESIYIDFFKELHEAVAQLDADKEGYGSNDLMYGGDVANWEKFANSLRLRLALRVRYADPALAATEMSDLNESNLISSAGNNAFVNTAYDNFENSGPNFRSQYSGLYTQGESLTKRQTGKTVLDIWKDNNDPRLKLFADTAEAAWPTTPGYETIDYFGYRGHPVLGYVPVEEKYPYGSGSVSRWSLHLYAPIFPMSVLSSQEVYFALAEAALAGVKGTPGDAQGFYEKGITEALNWAVAWNDLIEPQLTDMFGLYRPDSDAAFVTEYAEFHRVTADEAAAFVDTATVMTLTGTEEEQLEMIVNQKIAGFYPVQTYEAWCEWRRTGYPRVLVGHDDDALRGVSPRRYLYPDSEQQLNGDNLTEALSRMGGTDNMLLKMWWDANPLAPHEHAGEVESQPTPWVVGK